MLVESPKFPKYCNQHRNNGINQIFAELIFVNNKLISKYYKKKKNNNCKREIFINVRSKRIFSILFQRIGRKKKNCHKFEKKNIFAHKKKRKL